MIKFVKGFSLGWGRFSFLFESIRIAFATPAINRFWIASYHHKERRDRIDKKKTIVMYSNKKENLLFKGQALLLFIIN